jgi:hypothetical protein
MLDRKRPRHCTDEQLIAHADGELAWRKNFSVSRHLKRCWECRARQHDLEDEVRRISAAASQSPPFAADIARAKQRFLDWKRQEEFAHAFEPHPQRVSWIPWAAAFSAAAVLVAWVALPGPSRPITARDLLQRGQDAERTTAQVPAVHQVIDVRIRQERPVVREQTGRLEIWTDRPSRRYASHFLDGRGTLRYARWQPATGRREFFDAQAGARIQPAVIDASPENAMLRVGDADLDEIAQAFLEWVRRRPWQPVVLSDDLIQLESEDGTNIKAERLHAADGSPSFQITAEREARGVRVRFLLVLDPQSYRPRIEVVRFEKGQKSVELRLRVESLELGEGQRQPAVFVPRLPAEARQPTLARQPGAETDRRSDVADAAEVEVWHALHGLGACLDEVVDITGGSNGIRVHGLVASEERRREIFNALQAVNPGLELAIETGSQPHGRQSGGPDADATYAHSLALVRIAERFPAARAARLNAHSRSLLLAMLNDHLRALRSANIELRQLVSAGIAEGASAPAVAALAGKVWDQAIFELFRATDTLDASLEAGRRAKSPSPGVDLKPAFDSLDLRARELEALLARGLPTGLTSARH